MCLLKFTSHFTTETQIIEFSFFKCQNIYCRYYSEYDYFLMMDLDECLLLSISGVDTVQDLLKAIEAEDVDGTSFGISSLYYSPNKGESSRQ